MRKSPRPPRPPDPPKIESEVKTAVEKWLAERKLTGSELTVYGWMAIKTLSGKGCTAEDIVDVLELLWRYGQTQKFAMQKESRERWLTRAKNLVQRLRDDADEAETLLQFIAGSPTTTPTSTSATPQSGSARPFSPQSPLPKNETDDDSDDGSNPKPPALDAEVDSSPQSPLLGSEVQSEADTTLDREFLLDVHATYESIGNADMELWEVMRKYAVDLEANLTLQEDKDLPFAEPFSRKFAGTTGTIVWLVAAAALIQKVTGKRKPYKEISALLVVCADENLSQQSEGAVRLRIKGFRKKKRNKGFVSEFLTLDKVRETVSRWLGKSQRPR